MSTVVVRNRWHARAAAKTVATPALSTARQPVVLTPIPWGKPDRALGRAVCAHLVHANPPIRVEFNPFHHRRLSAFLRSHGIAH